MPAWIVYTMYILHKAHMYTRVHACHIGTCSTWTHPSCFLHSHHNPAYKCQVYHKPGGLHPCTYMYTNVTCIRGHIPTYHFPLHTCHVACTHRSSASQARGAMSHAHPCIYAMCLTMSQTCTYISLTCTHISHVACPMLALHTCSLLLVQCRL